MSRLSFVDLREDDIADMSAKSSLPFAVNPRGVLVHRVRGFGVFFSKDGNYSHHTAHYHCNNFAHGVKLVAVPDESAIVCQACESRCHYLGLPSADEIAGRHVHVGRKVAIANCHPEVIVDLNTPSA